MCPNYLHFFLIMVLTFYSQVHAFVDPVYCYQCSGLTCEPTTEHLLSCDNIMQRRVPRCYSIAWNVTNIYRGCYEREDEFVHHCNEHRLASQLMASCAICDGNGCNNQPLFQDNTRLSCKRCPIGVCGVNNTRQDFHTCDRFLMTIVPSCYQVIYYPMIFYTFGCTNELSTENLAFCFEDRLKLSCRFCFTQNCNSFPHDFKPRGNRKRCVDSVSEGAMRYCDRFLLLTNYAHCFMEVDFLRPRLHHKYSCTGSYPAEVSGLVTSKINFYNCWDTDCNSLKLLRFYMSHNVYRPCIDLTEPINVTFGALLDSCCALADYKDETDKRVTFNGCETKLNCHNSQICRRCCDDQMSFLRDGKLTCNQTPEKFTHQCFRCHGCLSVSDAILANQTYCMAEKGERRACYTFKNSNSSYRGCYHNDPYPLNKGLVACHDDPSNCKICEGDLCNKDEVAYHCFQCSFWNANCRFDQSLVGHLQDCKNFEFDAKSKGGAPGCYTTRRWDGTVERGCVDKNFECSNPYTAKCSICKGLACNYEGFQFGRCFACKGNLDSACALSINDVDEGRMTQLCPISFAKPLCYTFYDGPGDRIERGCTVKSLYIEQLTNRCARERNTTCITCDFDYCNYFTMKHLIASDCRRWNICYHILVLLIYSLYAF